MKKSLIALAVMAVAGTAMAQTTVNLTGRLGISYLDLETHNHPTVPVTAATRERQGISVTDGDIVFRTTEDLGGGMRAHASLGLQLRGRDSEVIARDASIALTGRFGMVAVASLEAVNGIMARGSAGAPVIGQDTVLGGLSVETISTPTNLDVLQYTSPELRPGLRFNVMLMDSIFFGRTAPTNTPGFGCPGGGAAVAGPHGGMGANECVMNASLVGVSYRSGPIDFSADYAVVDQNAVAAPAPDDRIRISGSYDFGVVRIGAGWERMTMTQPATDNHDTDWIVGISAPVGAKMVVGATYAERDASGTMFDSRGFELGAQYNFSRRTSLQVAYISREYKYAATTAMLAMMPGFRTQTDTREESALRVRLMHTF